MIVPYDLVSQASGMRYFKTFICKMSAWFQYQTLPHVVLYRSESDTPVSVKFLMTLKNKATYAPLPSFFFSFLVLLIF